MFFLSSNCTSEETTDDAMRSRRYRRSLDSDPVKKEQYKEAARERFSFFTLPNSHSSFKIQMDEKDKIISGLERRVKELEDLLVSKRGKETSQ